MIVVCKLHAEQLKGGQLTCSLEVSPGLPFLYQFEAFLCILKSDPLCISTNAVIHAQRDRAI
jgi:hypothetical protein